MKSGLLLLLGPLASLAVMATEPDWHAAASLSAPPASASPPPASNAGAEVARPDTGTAPLPLPGALPSAALDHAVRVTTPLSPEAVRQLRTGLDDVQRSAGTAPVTAAPRIRSLTVNLTPGASLPMMQVLPRYPGVVNFTDQTGTPWPIVAPPINGNPAGFQVNYLPDTPSMAIQARRPYDTGSVTVYLKGLAVPVVISLTSGEPGNPQASQPTDSRLDLRLPQRGPATGPVAAPRQTVGLYDERLQAFLDGVPPRAAQRIRTRGAVPDVQAWQLGDDVYLRARAELRDAFDSTLSSADGTHVWKMPVTPYVTFSVLGHNVPLTLELQ